jgi:hypothetical protein
MRTHLGSLGMAAGCPRRIEGQREHPFCPETTLRSGQKRGLTTAHTGNSMRQPEDLVPEARRHRSAHWELAPQDIRRSQSESGSDLRPLYQQQMQPQTNKSSGVLVRYDISLFICGFDLMCLQIPFPVSQSDRQHATTITSTRSQRLNPLAVSISTTNGFALSVISHAAGGDPVWLHSPLLYFSACHSFSL